MSQDEQAVATSAAVQEAAEALLGNKDTAAAGDTTQKTAASKEAPASDDAIFTLNSITQGEDGKYTLKVNDSTVYKGDSPDDVLTQLVDGKNKADSYIKQLKNVEGRFRKAGEDHGRKAAEGVVDEVDTIEPPNENDIYRKHLQAQVRIVQARTEGFDPKMISWKEADWNIYQEENGIKDWKIARLIAAVESITGKAEVTAQAEIDAANVAFVNVRNLAIEKEEVQKALDELLEETDIDDSKFDFDLMYSQASQNRDKKGFIKPGALMNEYRKQEKRILSSKSIVKKDLDDTLKAAEESRRKLHETPRGGGRVSDKNNSQSLEQAEDEIRKGIKAGRY